VGFARPDIADAALHHFVGSDRVNITDKLDFSFFTCFAAERKVVITGVLLSLQSLESGLIGCNGFEVTNLPKSQADHAFEWIVEQIEQKQIYIDDLTRVRIENQNAVLRGFKKAAVVQFRDFQGKPQEIFSPVDGQELSWVYKVMWYYQLRVPSRRSNESNDRKFSNGNINNLSFSKRKIRLEPRTGRVKVLRPTKKNA
jgi:hypothetical protein